MALRHFRLALPALYRAIPSITSPSPTSTCTPPHHNASLRVAAAVVGAAALSAPFALCEVQVQTNVRDTHDDHLLPPVSINEKLTGLRFPTSLSDSEKLAGASCRVMRQLVQVYAVGMYVNPSAVRALLHPWRLFSASDMLTAPPLWARLSEPSIAKTFRVVVVREVGGRHFADGFQRALVPRVQQRASERGGRPPREARELAKAFCKKFVKVGTMKVGSEVCIRIEGDSVLLVIDGRDMGAVEDDCLAWAVADMYVGEDGVVNGLRAELADGLSKMLG